MCFDVFFFVLQFHVHCTACLIRSTSKYTLKCPICEKEISSVITTLNERRAERERAREEVKPYAENRWQMWRIFLSLLLFV